jgi:hypothetical protein
MKSKRTTKNAMRNDAMYATKYRWFFFFVKCRRIKRQLCLDIWKNKKTWSETLCCPSLCNASNQRRGERRNKK